jgi:hypothetical protein
MEPKPDAIIENEEKIKRTLKHLFSNLTDKEIEEISEEAISLYFYLHLTESVSQGGVRKTLEYRILT